MKKLLTTTIVAALIASLGAAFAQPSQSHDVTINIPPVMMIRIVNTPSNAAVSNPAPVVFNLSSLDATSFNPEGTFTHPALTGVGAWNDVRVLVNQTVNWHVTVATTNNEFPWDRVHVTPVTNSSVAAFSLPTLSGGQRSIVSGATRTNGWRSLGFGPAQFELRLDGTEVAGTFTTTVTYTITNH